MQENAVELQVRRRRIEANKSGMVFGVVSLQGREGWRPQVLQPSDDRPAAQHADKRGTRSPKREKVNR